MKQRQLGPDGPWVGEVGLGGMYLSIQGRPEESQAIRTIHAALDAGVTFIDTANVYCLDDTDLGHNERLIAKAIQGRKGRVLVGTKAGMARPGGAWTRDGRPEAIMQACEASLRALGVETIDLYQFHAPDPKVPFMESVGAFSRLREAGKVRWVGLSNVTAVQIEQARTLLPIASVQNRWNPMHRAPERDGVLAMCERLGIAFLPYSPFGGANGARSLGSIVPLAQQAERRGVSSHRLVLGWMLQKSQVVICIPGARREQSIRDSAEASSIKLTREDMEEIETAMSPQRVGE